MSFCRKNDIKLFIPDLYARNVNSETSRNSVNDFNTFCDKILFAVFSLTVFNSFVPEIIFADISFFLLSAFISLILFAVNSIFGIIL